MNARRSAASVVMAVSMSLLSATVRAQEPSPPPPPAGEEAPAAPPTPEVSGPPPAYPAAGAGAARAPATVQGPVLRLNANNPRTRLQQQWEQTWRNICAEPCGVKVEASGTYRLGGSALRPTDPFQLPRSSGVVFVDGKMGSTVRHGVGVGLCIGGAIDVVSDVLTIVSASSLSDRYDNKLDKQFFVTLGILGFVRAAALLGVGVWLLGSSASSAEVR